MKTYSLLCAAAFLAVILAGCAGVDARREQRWAAFDPLRPDPEFRLLPDRPLLKFSRSGNRSAAGERAEEAAPLVVLESMAEGLPLIATKSGGVVEYVDKDTALLIERENVVEELQNAILYLKAHPEIRKRMSEQAKIRSKRYDEATYYRDFVKTIHEITGD